jgi:pimeloyl-ACP methyl ester carboxylesterase
VNDAETPQLNLIQEALAAGDLDGVRRALLDLDGREEELAREEMGAEAFERAKQAAAAGGRRGKLGKVLVLPGIMGSELDSVDRSGRAERIWLNFVNLILGRIDDLELTLDGEPAKAGCHVRLGGVLRKTYVPLIMELDMRWHVRPFAFDWREDLERSAARLDGEIKAFGNGDPVHLVAHSMGGLVSRLFAQRYPDTWKAMDDPTGAGRGGRLLMLGTPNRGSFAIPLVLTGAEKLLRKLALGDIDHSLTELLKIVSTFPGLYQMLPSPIVDLDDEHVRLFERETWGELHVHQSLLENARKTLTDLEQVIDSRRLIYVAGFNRPTPVAVRIDRPGRFLYQETLDGDGRVPHALGLLERDGVPTYWVEETHGDLAKNQNVLDAVADLLQLGDTSVLPKAKPTSRAIQQSSWTTGEALVPASPEADAILAKGQLSRAGKPSLSELDQIRLGNLLLDHYLGSGRELSSAGRPIAEKAAEGADTLDARRGRPHTVAVAVVWGDITKVKGEVYCVGHYQGVLPQRAELALDLAVSGIRPSEGEDDLDRRRLVITKHTHRGLLRGALGDVSFFPWSLGRGGSKLVAVAGMGWPGTFDVRALRRLSRELVFAVSALPKVTTVCTVLIGSGEGTLSIPEAVAGLVQGIGEAAGELVDGSALNIPKKLAIVELDRHRACEILEAVNAEIREGTETASPSAGRVRLVPNPKLVDGPGGTVSIEGGLALLLDSAIEAAGKPRKSPQGRAFTTLLADIPATEIVRDLTLAGFESEATTLPKRAQQKDGAEGRPAGLPRFRVERRKQGVAGPAIPVRISFWEEGETIKVAAIHQAATVPERAIRVDRDLIDDLVEKMTDPRDDQVDRLCGLLSRLLVPHDFREVLSTGPFVFEVDRAMARIQWELLASQLRAGAAPELLALSTPVARQLRTTYSPSPTPPQRPRRELRALVIGDPGDPAKRQDLPGARREALQVCQVLRSRNVDVTARIGAPSVPREGPLHDVEPADRLDVLGLLLEGGFDIVHYAGHGDFDADRPDRVGWVFSGGLLTPGELERVEHVPSIVVANACLSARTSQAILGEQPEGDSRTEAGLLPSLADEFFRLGVRNYIGTAWEVNDYGAELFARVLYESLIPNAHQARANASFGEAVLNARRMLRNRRATFGPLWAAYQHYGDPTSEARLLDESAARI